METALQTWEYLKNQANSPHIAVARGGGVWGYQDSKVSRDRLEMFVEISKEITKNFVVWDEQKELMLGENFFFFFDFF